MRSHLTPRSIRAVCAAVLVIGVGLVGSGADSPGERLGFLAVAVVTALLLVAAAPTKHAPPLRCDAGTVHD